MIDAFILFRLHVITLKGPDVVTIPCMDTMRPANAETLKSIITCTCSHWDDRLGCIKVVFQMCVAFSLKSATTTGASFFHLANERTNTRRTQAKCPWVIALEPQSGFAFMKVRPLVAFPAAIADESLVSLLTVQTGVHTVEILWCLRVHEIFGTRMVPASGMECR